MEHSGFRKQPVDFNSIFRVDGFLEQGGLQFLLSLGLSPYFSSASLKCRISRIGRQYDEQIGEVRLEDLCKSAPIRVQLGERHAPPKAGIDFIALAALRLRLLETCTPAHSAFLAASGP